MKVIVKSNEFIAIPTKKKSECLYLLGQYLNKETCTLEMDNEELKNIKCIKKQSDSTYSKTISLEANNFWGDKYIILDLEGNLVNIVDKKQFEDQYAILQEDSK